VGLKVWPVGREGEWGLAGRGMWRGGGRAPGSVTPHGGGRRGGGGASGRRHANGQRQPGNGGVGSRTGEAREERRERAGALMSGPAQRVGPSCREREEGREGDRWGTGW
jgi:hypothetical protein